MSIPLNIINSPLFADLKTDSITAINSKLKTLKLKKGDIYLHEGRVCREVGILEKGVFRVYYLANDKEYTSYFNVETRNILVAGFTSFFNPKPLT